MKFVSAIIFLSVGISDGFRADAQTDFFEAKIRPVLATHCFECHGNKDKGGLKLNSREAARKGGDSGAAGDRNIHPLEAWGIGKA